MSDFANIETTINLTTVTQQLDINVDPAQKLDIRIAEPTVGILYLAGKDGPPGPPGPAGSGIGTLNGLTGAVNIYGTGGNIFVITASPNAIYISGSGLATYNELVNLSGYLQTQITNSGSLLYDLLTGVSGNGANTSALSGYVNTQINLLSGLITGSSGALNQTIINSGDTLINYINGVGTNLSGNLYQTGSSLYNLTTGASGYLLTLINGMSAGVSSVNGLSGALSLQGVGNISITTQGSSNIIVSGNTGDYALFALKTDVTQTGIQLLAAINSLSGWAGAFSGILSQEITATGQASVTFTQNVSGVLQSNINSTGSHLYNLLTGFSGSSSSTYATKAELTQTGVTLLDTIGSLSGFTTGVSGTLNQNIAQTGSAAVGHANSIGQTLSGELSQTGSTLWNRDLAISGALQTLIDRADADVTSINGQSGALTLTGTGSVFITSGGPGIIVISGQETSLSGYIQSGDVAAISGVLSDQIFQTGSNLYTQLYNTGQTLWSRDANISGGLQTQINETGAAVIVHANNIGQTISGNLTITGQTLYNLITGISGLQSGQALNDKIDSLSGVVVLRFGDQLISGQKTWVDTGIFLSGIRNSGSIFFDIGNLNENLVDGQINWNGDYNTLQIGMNGGNVIQKVGFETYYHIKASGNISKGQVVMAVGAVGNSEFIIGASASGIGSRGERIMGVAVENIVHDEFGDVVAFGPVKQINTSAYQDGQILYYSPYVVGGLTGTPPPPPNAKVTVALVTHSHTNGSIFVRVTAGSTLGETDSNVSFTTLQDGDFIYYNAASGYWTNQIPTTGQISGMSQYALVSNLFATGSTLDNKINTLSGFVTGISGGLQVQINSTGNAAIVHANSVGQVISGNLTLTGQTLDNKINLLSGFNTGVSGALDARIIATGNAAVAHANGVGINLSGNLAQTGATLLAADLSLSGVLTGRLYQTGLDLYNQIYNTGQLLWNRDASISGGLQVQINSTGSAAISQANSIGQIISGNLTITGSTLDSKINVLSGFVTGVSGSFDTRLIATGNAAVAHANSIGSVISGNLTQTGSTLIAADLSLSGALSTRITQTGIDLYNQIYNTGQTLWNRDASISGGLQSQINSTGNAAISHANSIGGTISGNLTQTGVTLIAADLALSGALTGRIYQTGIDLYNQIYNTGQLLFNRDASISGGLQTQINSSGASVVQHANGIGTILSGNLTQTGITLIIRDNNISGVLQNQIDAISAGTGFIARDVVYTSGTQYISGTKYFLGNTYLDNIFVTGTQTVIHTQDVYVANNWMVLNATGGARDSAFFISTGFTGMNATGGVLGFDVPSNTWRFGLGGFMTDLITLPAIASINDILAASGGLEVRLALTGSAAVNHANSVGQTISGNLTNTGATLVALNLATSGALTGRLYQTGIDLYNQIYNTGQLLFNRDAAISGGLEARITATGNAAVLHANGIGVIISGNLTLTGQTLQGRIDSLSGFVGNVSGGLEARIVQTGNAAVAHANGIGVNLSGNLTTTGATLNNRINSLSGYVDTQDYATGRAAVMYASGISGVLQTNINSLSGFVLNASGALDNRIILTGNAAVAHANSIGQTISGNLTNTGQTLDNKINSLSGFVNNVSGGLEVRITQTGNAAISHANSIGLTISGNLTQTGSTLFNRDAAISGGLEARITATGNAAVAHANGIGINLSGNLTQTGATLSSQIAALSGFVTGANGGVFSYLTGLLPTGLDLYYINYPVVFPTIPRVSITMELGSMGNGIYGLAVSGRSTTGFFVHLTDTVDTSGVFLDVLVKT